MTSIKDAIINNKDKRKTKKLGYANLPTTEEVIETPVVKKVETKKKTKKEVV